MFSAISAARGVERLVDESAVVEGGHPLIEAERD